MLQVLQTQVDTQPQWFAGPRRLHHTDIAHHVALQVLDVALLAGHTPEVVVIGQLLEKRAAAFAGE